MSLSHPVQGSNKLHPRKVLEQGGGTHAFNKYGSPTLYQDSIQHRHEHSWRKVLVRDETVSKGGAAARVQLREKSPMPGSSKKKFNTES